MNHWKETAEIVSQLLELVAAGRRAALATVVGIEGSAYRRPGAKLLVVDTGTTLGSVSGGCLEADVREVAKSVLATGQSHLRRYDTSSSHEEIVWGLGLGCNGRVDVFVQPATEGSLAELVSPLAALLQGDAPFAIATAIGSSGNQETQELGAALLLAGDNAYGSLGSADLDRQAREQLLALDPTARSTTLQLDDRCVFFELMPPPPHLIVCGAGDDAQPLVASGDDAGFRVTLIDHRPALLTSERFPRATRRVLARPEDSAVELPEAARSLAVVMMHSFAHDREWARRLLAAGLPFVGLLGPRARSETLRREIGAEFDERLFGPVGLDLGAEGSRQIAISIVAQLLAFLSHREPRPLAERQEPIHAA